MNNYPEHLAEIQQMMGALGREIPETMKAFIGLHEAAAADGALTAKVKELVALAIAVTVRCDGCIAFHVHDAIQAGASREEIMEALGVAILMGGGPAVIYATEAFNAVDQFESEKAAA
jgi:AhpD family alkylhydroperoxidase